MEEEICMPGVTYMNTHTLMREDLPSDLMIKLDLQKVDPFPMTVPCLEGVGSCEYDICKVMMMMMMMMIMMMMKMMMTMMTVTMMMVMMMMMMLMMMVMAMMMMRMMMTVIA